MTTDVVISERYRLGPIIGQGGMGVVYRAFDETLEHSVAIKIVQTTEAPHLIRWFLRGARLAQQIKHPNVVRTSDHGRLEDGSAFLVMELVEGIDFDAVIASSLPLPQKLHLVSQILEALAHVHARGVLHRDIKPENILLQRNHAGSVQVKITDFGLAGLYDQRGPTEDGFDASDDRWVTGTPYYMAPERVDDRLPVGPTSDLYSLGVILYRLLSGDVPFPQPGIRGLYLKRTQEAAPIVPLRELDIPSSLINLTRRLIRLKMEDRYRVAADVIRDLKPHQSSFSLSPDNWIAISPTVLDKKFSQDETIAAGKRALNLVHLTEEFISNPALWERDDIRAKLELLAKSTEEGVGNIGVLLGIPGAGGDELLRIFSTSCAQAGRFTVLSGTFKSVAGARPGLRQALEGLLMSSELDRFRLRRFLWMQRLQLGLATEDDLDSLVDFLRPDSNPSNQTAHNQDEVFAVFVRTLRALSAERPVLLALDGLGDGGELSGSFIEFLIFELTYEPFPVLLLGSSGLLEFHSEFAERFARTDRHEDTLRHSIPLPPLKLEVLRDHLIRSFGVEPQDAARLSEEAGGLPVLAGALADFLGTSQRVGSEDLSLTTSTLDAPYRLSSPLAELMMDTVNRRLRERDDKDILNWILCCVAVLGDEVSLSILELLVSDRLQPDEFDDHIDSLIRLKLLSDRGALGQRAVRLQPSILRRALLEGRSANFKSLHRRAATVRRSIDPAEVERELGAIGDHLAAAGDMAEAREHWIQALDFEVRYGDTLLGAAFGVKALAAMEPDDSRKNPLAIRLGRALLDAGSPNRAEGVLDQVLQTGGPDDALFAGEVLADLFENYGRSEAWKKLVEDLELREEEASPAGRRALLRTRSMWLNSYGRSEEALRDAQAALKDAVEGPEIQRAAQRLVYCCLSTGDLALAEQGARKALEASEERADLRVRSLRALGVVLTWRGRPAEGAKAQEEALTLCRRRGLTARTPIALHDLADAWRLSGRLNKAEQAYQQAIETGEELVLSHTVELSRVKQVMCRLGRGETEGAVEALRQLGPSAVSAGLGLAVPFCALLEAWAYALDDNSEATLEALDRVGTLEGIAVDPHVASIFRAIAAALPDEPRGKAFKVQLLGLAVKLEANSGETTQPR